MVDTEKDDPRTIPRRDEKASPLGRGADPGTSVEGGSPDARGPAGPHGMNVPGEKGGPEGMLHRENEDAVPKARRDARERL